MTYKKICYTKSISKKEIIIVAKYKRIFCENCGVEINADISQQYVKCDSCGAVINNPKYVGQSDTFVQTTGEGDFGKLFSTEKKKGFNKLKGFFGFGRDDDDDDDEDYDDDEDVEIETLDDIIEEFDEDDEADFVVLDAEDSEEL